MRTEFIAVLIAISMIAACHSKSTKVNHQDPEAVAVATITAFRDRDLETLANTFHPEHANEFRQSALDHLSDGKPVEEWTLFAEGGEIAFMRDWDGYLEGPKYERWSEVVILYIAKKPDRYNSVPVLVLMRFEGGWFVAHIKSYDYGDFVSLPNSEEELVLFEKEQCEIFSNDCMQDNMCEMFEEFCVNDRK